jgi:SAM-dependent methyltransferase
VPTPEPERTATSSGAELGHDQRAGGPHYRAYVGPPRDYDRIGGLQFTLLFQAGLREHHRLLDLGCGSLRGGRLFIPYLLPGNYTGVEPNEWLVKDGIARELGEDILAVKRPTFSTIDDFDLEPLGRFDYVLAQSILSHSYPDLTAKALAGVRACLAEDGLLLATFLHGELSEGTGWCYPRCTSYGWDDIAALAGDAGLVVRHLDWPHPRQTWFAAARSEAPLRRF